MNKFLKLMLVGLSATFILSGCGSTSNSTTDDIKTGTFVDAPVYGLKYETATQSGYTDASGGFKYKSGETIEFFLNTLSLGQAPVGDLITPYTLGDSNSSNPSNKTLNIALLLQNFDSNRSDTTTVDVSKCKDLGIYDLSYIDLNQTTKAMENEISALLNTPDFRQYTDTKNFTLKTTNNVKSSMDNYIDIVKNGTNRLTVKSVELK